MHHLLFRHARPLRRHTDGWPTRQSSICPHVWQVPCGCGAVTWQCDWPSAQPVWICRGCGAQYGVDQAQIQGQHTGLCLPSME